MEATVRQVSGIGRRSRRLPLLLFLAYASLIAVFQGIQNILIPATVQRLAPTTKLSTLTILTTLAAITTVVALLGGGVLSDRTRTRFGRRTPWLVAMATASIVIMLLMGISTSLASLYVLMPLLWFTANFYQTVVTTILPDRVPPAERGFAAAAMALGVPVGIFVGVNLAALSTSNLMGYGMLTIPLALATAALVIIEREPPSPTIKASHAGSAFDRSGSLFAAFSDRNFSLAFVSRFLLFLSFFTVNGYLFYVLQDYVGPARLPGGSVASAVSVVLSLTTAAWIVITPITGILSDRVGHTARIVAYTSIAIGAVFLVPSFTNSWQGMLMLGVGLGLTFGIYFAIDLKLATLVLPSDATAGRDIGLMGVAASGPTVIAPALAAGIIHYGGFPMLFVSGALLAVAGGVSAFPIRISTATRDD